MKALSSKTSLAIVALVAAACSGADGERGDPGAPGAPPPGGPDGTARLVVPGKGALDREIEVVVSGSGTSFSNSTPLDFGPGVTVVSKQLVSTTSILAKIKIEKSAALGPRDVVVGGLTASKAFNVIAAITVKPGAGAEQGGVGQVELENQDQAAFDTDAFRVTAAGLVDFGAFARNAFAGEGMLLVPPLAPLGKVQVAAENLDAKGETRLSFFSAADALDVTARAATTIALGTPRNAEAFAGALGSKLYKVTTAANQNAILDLTMHVGAQDKSVLTAVLWGAGGKADDMLGRADAVEQTIFGPFPKDPPYDLHYAIPIASGAAKDFYLSVIDGSGESGAKFDLRPTTTPATVLTEGAAAHDTEATAEPLAIAAPGAGHLLQGSITDDKFDWYKMTVLQDELVDIALDTAATLNAGVYKAGEGFLAVASGGPKNAASARTEALDAGEYLVAVARGTSDPTKTTKGPYTLAIRRIAPLP
ncbi:MAG: hypothetical protein KF819_23120 [Labilithrix sp.]|nr:hypothetical protein [Labilithrix sp.]